MNQSDAFSKFRALHAGDSVLVLANAWDAASAALFAAAGTKAMATSSAGLAWSCGYADGNALPPSRLLSAVSAICAVVPDMPVTVDVEGGYSDEPDQVANLVAQLRGLGVAGINIEDGSDTPELLVAKIAAVKQRVRSEGGDVFINARTDVFLRELTTNEDAVHETISRATQYTQAGADGIFVPELKDRDAIRSIAGGVGLPLNLMAVPELPPAPELFALGVRRLSAGASLAKLAYGAALDATKAFLRNGDSAAVFSSRSIDYGEMNVRLLQGA